MISNINMETVLKTNITVKDICEGFVYNELEGKGSFGLSELLLGINAEASIETKGLKT